jgi:PAS domain S-box-containing protein
MKRRFNKEHDSVRDKLIGLGERSIKKSYYPELKRRMLELERFRALVDEAGDAIFLMKLPSCRIVDINQTACRRLGVSREKILGSAMMMWISPEKKEAFTVLLEGLKEGRAIFEFCSELINHNNEILPVEFSFKQHVFQGLPYTVAMARDIAERLQAEKTKANLEMQLRQSQKMEALGKLSGGIAHDFNNILQAISGYTQLLLLNKGEDDADRDHLTQIHLASQRASDIIRRLLAFSRKMDVKLQVVNLNDIIRNTIRLLEHTTPKMIAIKTRLEDDLKLIQADPVQMEQIIINLANNAVDAMNENGSIFFETRNVNLENGKYLELETGEYVLLKISDTGHGMDAATISQIFEPFFTTKPVERGTGLGLSIVYGIVKSHQGHISCYSEPGVGTTFSVYLPVPLLPLAADELIETKEEKTDYHGTETIMVVDDEEMIQDIAEKMLTYHGYAVKKAMNGEAALEIMRREKNAPDLVILDLGMPGMGGEKCLQEVLALNPKQKIIVASGYAAHEIAREPEKFGAAGFISKPFALPDLLRIIRETLEQGGETTGEL